jgi:hypothetical protein
LEIGKTTLKQTPTKEMDLVEKKLLDIFNYYNREYKPFKIEKEHKQHDLHTCSKLIQNKTIEKKLKTRVFEIQKVKKIDKQIERFTTFFDFSTRLNEYTNKFLYSNQMLLGGSYNYDGAGQFLQELLNSVVCVSTCESDFQNYFVRFHECFLLLHEELKEKINFWKEFFRLANCMKQKEYLLLDDLPRGYRNEF